MKLFGHRVHKRNLTCKMDKKQEPKQHHYVPRVYLKNFCVEDRLYALDVSKVQKGYREAPKLRTTKQVCYFDDYYTITEAMESLLFRLDMYDSLHVERKVFERLENNYGKIMGCVFAEQSLDFQQALDLTDFILQLKLRNPYWMQHTLYKNKENFIDTAINNLIAGGLDDEGKYVDIPLGLRMAILEDFRKESKDTLNFSKQLQLFSLINRQQNNGRRNEEFRLAFMDCTWSIYHSPRQGPQFITSDNPGYSTKGDGLGYNTNFTAPFTFFLPLSPRHCLVVNDRSKDLAYSHGRSTKVIQHKQVVADQVIQINNGGLKTMNKMLIAADDWYLAQIAKLNNPNLKK